MQMIISTRFKMIRLIMRMVLKTKKRINGLMRLSTSSNSIVNIGGTGLSFLALTLFS